MVDHGIDMKNAPRFLNLGDSALTVEFGDRIEPPLVEAVAAFDRRLNRSMEQGELRGVTETIPTYRSLTVLFDPLQQSREQLQQRLLSLLAEPEESLERNVRSWSLPVCYGGEYGPDLKRVANSCGLSLDEVVDLHSRQNYQVYMIGFAPGFPYMGEVPAQLQMPRLKEPRIRVPVGSVAITGSQTAIYPWESPGGWLLLGRCPLSLFDASRAEPALLAAGDRVSFQSVTLADFSDYAAAACAGTLDYSIFLRQRGGQ